MFSCRSSTDSFKNNTYRISVINHATNIEILMLKIE